jgi:hypothetical protein
MAYAEDLKSSGRKRLCGFDSRPGYQSLPITLFRALINVGGVAGGYEAVSNSSVNSVFELAGNSPFTYAGSGNGFPVAQLKLRQRGRQRSGVLEQVVSGQKAVRPTLL